MPQQDIFSSHVEVPRMTTKRSPLTKGHNSYLFQETVQRPDHQHLSGISAPFYFNFRVHVSESELA